MRQCSACEFVQKAQSERRLIYQHYIFHTMMQCLGNWGLAPWAAESKADLLNSPSRRRTSAFLNYINASLNCRHSFSRSDTACLVFYLHTHMVNNMIHIRGRWQCYMCRWRALIKQSWALPFPMRTMYFSWNGALQCSALPLPSYILYCPCLPCLTGHPAGYLSIASHE